MHRFTKLNTVIAAQTKRLTREESGATAIEYALIAAGIAVVIIAAVNGLGTATTGMFESVSTALK